MLTSCIIIAIFRIPFFTPISVL